MAPGIDGEVHWFAEHGLYDGLFLMKDEESGTYWDHMTGEAVYGPLTGSRLEVFNLTQSTVAQVLSQDRDAQVTISDQAIRTDEQMNTRSLLSRVSGRLNRMFSSTVKKEDDRRPTMDIGMGIWEDGLARYYPYDEVVERGRAVFDTFGGRQVVIYLDPSAYSLAAAYTNADSFRWDDATLRFSDGSYIENAIFYDASGERAQIERPLQVFTRWYGFSLTFPQTGIFGEER